MRFLFPYVQWNFPLDRNKRQNSEVRFVEPYQFKAGSKESGQAWSEVAGAVNQYDWFKVMPRDQRSVRDRLNKLLGD